MINNFVSEAITHLILTGNFMLMILSQFKLVANIDNSLWNNNQNSLTYN